MKDPHRFIKEPCEFCGNAPTIRWYDCCCDKQYQKYVQECKEFKAMREEMEYNYNLSFGTLEKISVP